MRFAKAYVLAFSSLLLALSALAQQTSTATPQSSPQALVLLQKSLAALTGGQPITDVTLTGTARRIAGSDDESGTAILKAMPGASRMDLTLSSGTQSEIENLTGATPAGTWSGSDGISHAMAYHNLLSEPSWFFPAFAIARRLSTSGTVATYIGEEMHNGQSVQHVSVSQVSSVPDTPGIPTFQHLTQVDLFLDSATLLPAAITFNTHPDNDMGLDLPVEERFSDYRSVNAAQIPFHVQKFLNSNLLLDFQAQSVTPNSGLSISTFSTL